MHRYLVAAVATAVAAACSLPAAAGQQSDEKKAEQIAVQLRDSGRMRNYSVGVKYNAGTAWLSGRVASNEQMKAALEVVTDMEGVNRIVNNLTVSGGDAALKQPMARQSSSGNRYARRASNAEAIADEAAMAPPRAAGRRRASTASLAPTRTAARPRTDSQVTPAGFRRLAARKAARHACPPNMYAPMGGGANPPAYDQPYMPNYAWPSYAAYPNYAALTYPQQYSPTAWPYIGPFYPYPQVPLGWRKVALEWDDGWWFLDFYDRSHH